MTGSAASAKLRLMRRVILSSLLLVMVGSQSRSSARDTDSFVQRYLRMEIPIESPTRFAHEYYILAADAQIPPALFQLLSDETQRGYWEDAFTALGIIGSVDRARFPFDQLAAAVLRLESKRFTLEGAEFFLALDSAYRAVGRYGGAQAEEFLWKRLDAGFWGAAVPRHVWKYSVGSAVSIETGQSKAVYGLGMIVTPALRQRLVALAETPSVDPILLSATRIALESWDLEKELLEIRQAAANSLK